MDDFARRFSMRSARLAWLLGAGCSAAAGIPTAWDLIWRFKQELYISKRRIPRSSVEDIRNPSVQRSIQSFIDSLENFPQPDAPDEYAALFEAAYPSEVDRRTFLDTWIRGGKPSYGHVALATLMKADRARCVWTTNFDAVVADACATVFGGTGHLATASLDAPGLAEEIINGDMWPAEIKLHGDFRSRRLKNSSEELRTQDSRLRHQLVTSSRRSGLVVAGYSGRDDSVMDALEEVLEGPTPFPGGLFWLHRDGSAPLPRVARLLTRAASAKVDGGLVVIESFDEAMQDLVRQVSGIDTTALDAFARARSVVSDAPRPRGDRDFPALRLNAIHVSQTPSVCRVVDCGIGGHAEVRKAVEDAGADILATRVKAGVLAFGLEDEIRRVLAPFGIKAVDVHALDERRFWKDTMERGLLRDALARALAQTHDLTVNRRRNEVLLAPRDPDDKRWAPLQAIVGRLSGTSPSHPDLVWREGISMRLDWVAGRVWMITDPRMVFDHIPPSARAAAADLGRERTVRRYNKVLSDLISFWASMLSSNGDPIRAFGGGADVDAVFRLGTRSAFSRRARE